MPKVDEAGLEAQASTFFWVWIWLAGVACLPVFCGIDVLFFALRELHLAKLCMPCPDGLSFTVMMAGILLIVVGTDVSGATSWKYGLKAALGSVLTSRARA